MFKNMFSSIRSWLSWAKHKARLEKKYKGLKLGYMTFVHDCTFGKYNQIGDWSAMHRCKMSDFSYIGDYSRVRGTTIGKFCSIGPGFKCGIGIHPVHYVSTHPAFYSIEEHLTKTFSSHNHYKGWADIKIGHDVWIGANVFVKDGVQIGTGAVIGAGAVVLEDVPAYAIYGGVPAKIIKYRFDEEKRKSLLDSEWWEKDEGWLHRNYSLFHHPEEFLGKVKAD